MRSDRLLFERTNLALEGLEEILDEVIEEDDFNFKAAASSAAFLIFQPFLGPGLRYALGSTFCFLTTGCEAAVELVNLFFHPFLGPGFFLSSPFLLIMIFGLMFLLVVVDRLVFVVEDLELDLVTEDLEIVLVVALAGGVGRRVDLLAGSVICFGFTMTATGFGFGGSGFESGSCPDIKKDICCRSVIFEKSTEPSAFRGNTSGRRDIV